ncbi:hypothetical protein QWI18_09425 [Pseudomonas sp. W2Oct36]|uniref:hypothetical protein n=1 Tax=unclassified Pseudomonas TaxID=196821 RepID=UPI000C131B68|nr:MULTISPECIES: hypothetical protein [unclassified Pseudomonas]MBD8600010.1 hypothetical protein [Pseudomonas sp. CFBP 8772]PHX39521.1 hypothetical protein AO263_35385 [Pseudomonas sp. NZIPFR-PS5]RZI76033.1 MAG: hypothetical protein EOP13_03400 [Pseudomonas sp.]
MNRLLVLSLLLSASLLAGCAAGNHPELRAYSAEETHQLALEDLNRGGLSYDEFQARKARLIEQPQLQRAHAFDNRGEVNAEVSVASKARQG